MVAHGTGGSAVARTYGRLGIFGNKAVMAATLAAALILAAGVLATADQEATTPAITEQETAMPAITAPPDVTVNAGGILSTVDLGTVEVTGMAGPDIVVTNNVTGDHGTVALLGFGTTDVLWTATDGSGNTATAVSTITVDPSDLDTTWQYWMTETHVSYLPHSALAPSMRLWSLDGIELTSSDVNGGTLHLFRSFPAEDLRGRDIILDMELDTGPYVKAYVLDGAYSKDVPSDFTPSGPVAKGGGVLATFVLPHPATAPPAASNLTVVLSPDWSESQMDRATVFIDAARPPHGQSLILRSVDIEGHSKWIFDGYRVRQGAGYGTFELFPPEPASLQRHPIPINDTFDSSLDGWSYWGSTADHALDRQHLPYLENAAPPAGYGTTDIGDIHREGPSLRGSPPPPAWDDTTEHTHDRQQARGGTAAHIHTDGFSINTGMQKTVDVSGFDESRQRLVLSYDYRASSYTAGAATNSYMTLLDADSGALLSHTNAVRGGTTDTGWQTYTTDITEHASGLETMRIVLYMTDAWIVDHDQHNWYDNVRMYTVDQTSPVHTSNTYVPGPVHTCPFCE